MRATQHTGTAFTAAGGKCSMKLKHKHCFTNAHCCFECPNAAADEFEERYDIPASDAGYERIESCKVCYLNTGECEDCLFQHSKECPEVSEP